MTQWRQGFSLPQQEYIASSQYQVDVEALGRTQWLLIEHESRIPNIGDWFTFDWSAEQVIVIRGDDHQIRGFYNVCRHRGSRICLSENGNSRMLICPYHAWGYDLQGKLKGAPLMPDDFEKSDQSLKPVHIGVYEGLIFINCANDQPPSFSDFTNRFDPFFFPFDLKSAKIAFRHNIPNRANWKLVLENFFECYHCKSSHPTYCSVHNPVKLLALGAGPGSGSPELFAKYESKLAAWEKSLQNEGLFTGMWSDDAETPWMQSAARVPIADDFLTESLDGQPIGPLLGAQVKFDGAQTACAFNVLSIVLINPDHAVLFRIAPRGPLQTDFELIWLVSPDFDLNDPAAIDKLTELWTITAIEDKKITEDNQAGVLSNAYEPGYLSTQESRISDFGIWYHRILLS